MRKIFGILLIVLFVGFSGCENTFDGADGIAHNPDDATKEDNYVTWMANRMHDVAYMFVYTPFNVSDPSGLQANYNNYRGPNERIGTCVDYAIHLALLIDGFVIASPPLINAGIYKIVNNETPITSGGNWHPYNNGIIATSRDLTEAWYLEKVGEFHINLRTDIYEPVPQNHAWTLSECGNYVMDAGNLDAGNLYAGPRKIN